ncbi:MAG TPA: ThuA domain-containing protein [Opitutus sp.]|nr:ThuA domain-containing protein [Opitutus sp.]
MFFSTRLLRLAALALVSVTTSFAVSHPVYKLLLITGQSSKYHDWTKSSPLVKKYLEQTGLFTVDVATTPPRGSDLSGFQPDFAPYAAVVVVYEGDEWPAATKAAFVDYMKNGGGLVAIHDTDNAFPYWPEWNEMIGVGGWGLKPDGNLGARTEKWGPKIRWRDGHQVLDDSPGVATHPARHEFIVSTRAPDHPIMRGLPAEWLHTSDEAYSQLRGPAKNVEVLATACPDPAQHKGTTGENEPMVMTIRYGKGRVFHLTLGHVGPTETPPYPAIQGVGYITLVQRGTEWAATGRVTQSVPADFPTATRSSMRP